MPKDPSRFETSFGELMALQGVKKIAPPAPPPPPAAAAAPTSRAGRGSSRAPAAVAAAERGGALPPVSLRHEDPYQAELRQLLDAAHELREQRAVLRDQLARQEKQLEQHITDKAELTVKLRRMESLRHEDMALITQLRKENTALQESHDHLAQQCKKLQHALQSQQARTPPPLAAPSPQPLVPTPVTAAPPLTGEAEGDDEDSAQRRAASVLVCACKSVGVRRLVVVGGSPVYRQRLRVLLGEALELRLIGDRERRTQQQARADVDWGGAVFIWGGSILDHSLSQLYEGPKVRVVAHRGLTQMLVLAAESLPTGAAAAQ